MKSKLSNLLIVFKQSKACYAISVDSVIVAKNAQAACLTECRGLHILALPLVIFSQWHHIPYMFYFATA